MRQIPITKPVLGEAELDDGVRLVHRFDLQTHNIDVRQCESLGAEQTIAHRGSSAQGDLVGDNAAMKEILGVSPRLSLRDGLRGVVDHVTAASAV